MLLVVDPRDYDYYKSQNIQITGSMDNISYKRTPNIAPSMEVSKEIGIESPMHTILLQFIKDTQRNFEDVKAVNDKQLTGIRYIKWKLDNQDNAIFMFGGFGMVLIGVGMIGIFGVIASGRVWIL